MQDGWLAVREVCSRPETLGALSEGRAGKAILYIRVRVTEFERCPRRGVCMCVCSFVLKQRLKGALSVFVALDTLPRKKRLT